MNSKNTPLFLLIGFIMVASLASIVVIIIRAPSTTDALTLIGAIIAFTAPLITSLIALIRAEAANGTAKTAEQVVIAHVANEQPPPPQGATG